ncbi:MAG: glycosyltransferase family 2 protein, partial [Cyanobacteria bacterium REEB65]|nr:glycosyltransferase family 2 protein [Cyanobacteria bacterium REEB65]
MTVIVPCYNEEDTVSATMDSLLALDYPEDKLSIIAVDDGSRDRTWELLGGYGGNPRVRLVRKENGGKHTAVNLGLSMCRSELVSCLDSDSFVHPQALRRMVPLFDDPAVMAVAPAIKVIRPQNLLERVQAAEYNIGIYLRKVYSLFD